MIDLESRIQEIVADLAPASKAGMAISGIKKTLNTSSQIVDAVNNIGDSLQNNLGKGGVVGKVGGWMAGKTTKVVGGVAGTVVAGTLKTVADIIPDSSDMKSPDTDKKIAYCIDTYPLPTDKSSLFDLLQFVAKNVDTKNSPYGKNAIGAFKNLHEKVGAALSIAAKGDIDLLKLAKSYMPKKKFGIF